MEWILIIIVLIVLCIGIIKIKSTASKEDYERIEHLFSPAERSFYGVLCQAVGEEAIVFGKVRIADIMRPKRGMDRASWQKAFNRISSKHFDFVLCKPSDLSVIAAIELDDKSHSSKKARARDQFVESSCASAGLKLHRFKVESGYNVDAVRSTLFPSSKEAVSINKLALSIKENQLSASSVKLPRVTTCPKCKSEMVKRLAKNGKNKGKEFLACSGFPKCRYTEGISLN